jgi:hypothetical protein
MSKSRLFSGKIKKLSGGNLTVDRYEYLDASQAEPDLGLPSLKGSVLTGSTSTSVRTWSNILTANTNSVSIFSTLSNFGFESPNALMISGGVSIAKDLNVAGKAYLNNAEILTTQSGLSSILGISIINQTLFINTNTNSTSTNSGALIVGGGVGISGDLYVGGKIVAQELDIQLTTVTTTLIVTDDIISTYNTTSSTGTTTGALIVAGGVGIGGSVNIAGGLVASGINLLNKNQHLWYVDPVIGVDDYTKNGHPLSPARTIKYALSYADSGDTVFIQPGTYYEEFPLTINEGVSVRGAGLREVVIYPTTATNTSTAFLLNGEALISDFTVGGFFKPGYAFEFAPGAVTTTKSPYIERFSVITKGSVTSAGDPYGFDSNDAGGGAKIDGSRVLSTSAQASIMFNEATFIVPNATGLYMTNGARAEVINTFFYFADKAIHAVTSSTGYAGAGKTKLKLGGISGTLSVGDTLFYKTSGGATLASGTIASVDGSYVYITGAAWGFDTVTTRNAKIISVLGNTNVDTVVKKYGTGSAKFDGTGDALTIPPSVDFAFGTGTFTIECWVRLNTLTGTQILFDFRNDGTTPSSYAPIITLSAGTLVYQTLAGNRIVGTALTTSTWYHVALARSGTATKLFLNGTQVGSTYTDSNNYIQGPLTIGAQYNSSNSVNGYIDDIRVTKGLARYTTSFVAPTSALVVDEYTVLMLHANGILGSTVFSDENAVPQVIYSTGTNYATATSIDLADYHQFGAEIRSLGSAAIFGNTGVTADGTGTDIKLIAFNVSHIGAGKDSSDDISLVVQANEIIQINGGKVYFQTVDQGGDFRVGESFLVNQRTGDVSFGNAQVNLGNLGQLTVTDGSNNAVILPTSVSVGSLVLSGGSLVTQAGNLTLDPAGTLTTINSNLQVDGNIYANAFFANTTSFVANAEIITTSTLAQRLQTITYLASYITMDPTQVVVSGTSTTYGNYQSGDLASISTYGDYDIGGYYEVWDAAGAPGFIVYVGFDNIPEFNRLAMNISYTVNSGHTIEIDLYNYETSAWDAFGQYTGLNGYFTFALGVISSVPYISSGTVTLRLYHINAGNASLPHKTRIDYVALEKSIQGGQGPRGFIGYTGSQGLTTTTNSQFVFANTASSTSTDTGSVTVRGGVGVRGDVYVGGKIYSETALVLTTATVNEYANQTALTAGTDTAVSASSGSITVWNTSTLESVTGRGNSTTKGINIIGDFGFSGTTSTFDSTLLFDNSYSDEARGPNKIKLYDDGAWIGGVGVSYNSVDIYSGKETNFYQGAGAETNNVGYRSLSISSSSVVIHITSASVSTATGALQVVGGVGIGGDLYVGGALYQDGQKVITTSTINDFANQTIITAGTDTAVSTSTGNITVWNTSDLQTVTDRGSSTTNAVSILNTSNAVSITTAAFIVSGGVSIGLDLRVGGRLYANNLEVVTTATVDQSLNQTLQSITEKGFTTTTRINILNTLSSTATVTENALYVAGGVGIGKSLYVTGKTLFQDDVTFAGNSTFIYSTNTYYTDNLIELHAPGAVYNEWTTNDGKDIGLRFHYYRTIGGDSNAALVFSPTTGYLEWYGLGAETDTGVFTTATHGSFKVGEINIVNSTTSFSTNSGALRVVGGVGIGGDLWVGGNIYGVSTGSTFSGTANAATNISGGAQYQIPFQSTTGTTNFDNKLRWISASSTLAIGTPNDPLGSLTVENNVTVGNVLNVSRIRAIDTSSLYFNASGIYNTVTSTSSYYWSFGSDGRTNFPNYSFPANDGPYGFALVTDGTGTVSWSPVLSYVGSIGYTGSSSGFTGSAGYIGSIGFVGSIGYVGSPGAGFTGSSSGYIGSFGYTGSIGYSGSSGAGYTGSKGFIGSEGYTGSSGAGYTGSTGNVGYIGSTGLTGYVGSRGVDGTSVRILGSVPNTTDLPGWQYTYTGAIGDGYIVTASGHLWVWSGTMWADAGLISGPQGDRGFIGSSGAGYVGSSAPGYTGSIGYQGSKGALDPWTKIVANYSASNNQRLIADTSAGQFTVALPDSPTIGSYLIITDGYSWSTTPLLVTSSVGTTIEGYGETLQLDITGITVEFIWSGATWQVTATLGVRGAGGYTGSMGAFAAIGFTGSQAGLTAVSTNILPVTSGTYSLGADYKGWTSVYTNFGYIGSNLYVGNETVDSLTVSKTLIVSTSTIYLGGNTLNINAQGTMLLNNAQVGVSVAQATALSAAMSVVLGM